MIKRSSIIGLLFVLWTTSVAVAGQDGGYDITSDLWAKVVLEVANNPVTLKWKMVGADITPSGDQVISGYFYADPNDFAYGSVYNPELFVKIYIARNGWCNMAFNHVTVDDVSIYSMSNGESQSSTATLNSRLVEHQYNGVVIDATLQTAGETAATSHSEGYTLNSGLWAKAVLQPFTGAVNLIWKEVGTDITPSGDTVVSGYFYASPEDFPYGSLYNPEVFVKVYIAANGWANMAFNHVTVDDVSVYSMSGEESQSSTATLNTRLVEHQYNGVSIDDISSDDNGLSPDTDNGSESSVPNKWTANCVKAIDSWGDLEGNSSEDIIALYYKEDEDNVYFRVDLMDLAENQEQNIYIVVDYLDGGNTELVQSNSEATSDISWDLLLSSNAFSGPLVFDTKYQDHPEYLKSFTYENEVDYIEFTVLKSSFSDWNGGPFDIQAIVTTTSGSAILDKTEVVSTNSDTSNMRAHLVLFFVNLLLNNSPYTINWYEGFVFTPSDRPDEYTGCKYLLDAIEKYQLPLCLEHGVYLLPGDDYLNIGNRLKGLADEGLLEILGGLYYGHFFPMQPDDVNTVALHLAKETRQNMGYIDSNVFYPYEGLLRVRDVETIRNAGYQAIYAHDRYGYITGWINDWSDDDKNLEMFELATKIHKINGMTFFFSPGCFYGGFASDERWGDIVYPDTAEIFQGTDNGLHLMYRRILMDLAVDQDQEKYFMIGTDFLLTPWLYQDVVENNIKWIAEHPWIEVVTLSNLLGRNWTPIDHGNLSLALDEPLEQYQKNGDGHYNAYFWQHYYGGIADGHSPFAAAGTEIESYYDYIPYIRDGELIPSGLKMGDDQTENTIAYITINNLRNAPDNPLTELAWRYYFGNTGERAFHGMDESTGAVLHPAAKEQANYLGHTNKIIAASHWADEIKNGIQSQAPEVLRQDFDLDGEDEYAISNDKVFAIFENDGGKLEFAFAYDSVVGPIQLIAPNQQTPIPNHMGYYTDGEISNSSSGVYAAFFESGYQTDLFKATNTSDSLTFTSNDGKIMKSL